MTKQDKPKIKESALHYGLKKQVKISFIDGTSIKGQLDFVNKYEYVLKDATQRVRKSGNIVDQQFENEVVVLKAAVKYLTVVE